MNWSELNNLELKDLASAPAPVRIALTMLIFLAVLGLGWYLLWAPALTSLEQARQEEQALKDAFTTKKNQAYHYETYKQRLSEIERSLGSLLRQLPNRAEMDALLTDINQVGVGRGLDFQLFRPGTEMPADFYATLPVSIRVTGSYHAIGEFVSDVARLPRIVTLHDVVLTQHKDKILVLDARVQTYRYLDEAEMAAAKKAQPPS